MQEIQRPPFYSYVILRGSVYDYFRVHILLNGARTSFAQVAGSPVRTTSHVHRRLADITGCCGRVTDKAELIQLLRIASASPTTHQSDSDQRHAGAG